MAKRRRRREKVNKETSEYKGKVQKHQRSGKNTMRRRNGCEDMETKKWQRTYGVEETETKKRRQKNGDKRSADEEMARKIPSEINSVIRKARKECQRRYGYCKIDVQMATEERYRDTMMKKK